MSILYHPAFRSSEIFSCINDLINFDGIDSSEDLNREHQKKIAAALLKAKISDVETIVVKSFSDYMSDSSSNNKDAFLCTLKNSALSEDHITEIVDEIDECCDVRKVFENYFRKYLVSGSSETGDLICQCLTRATIHRFSYDIDDIVDEQILRRSMQ